MTMRCHNHRLANLHMAYVIHHGAPLHVATILCPMVKLATLCRRVVHCTAGFPPANEAHACCWTCLLGSLPSAGWVRVMRTATCQACQILWRAPPYSGVLLLSAAFLLASVTFFTSSLVDLQGAHKQILQPW
jgi:hypothetical protein